MKFINIFFINKISIKKISFFRSILRIETFNNSYCDSLGNFLRRTMFLTTFCFVIYCIKIYKVLSEYDNIPGILESTKQIILNLESIIFNVLESNIAYLIIKKKGPCIITAKDIFSDKKIIIYNPNQVIAHVNNSNYFFCIMKCYHNSFKIKKNENFKFFIFDSNIIYLNFNNNPIININYYIKSKFFNKKLKILFLDIETNGSVFPEFCFKNCIFYIKKYFDILFNTIGYKKKQKKYVKNFIYYKPIEFLGFDNHVSNFLKMNNIFSIIELINLSKKDLESFNFINLSLYNKIIKILKKNKLNLKNEEY